MFKKISFIFFILIVHTTAFAQRRLKDINADLKNAKTDSNKANFLLELALAYVLKPGNEKQDIDSAILLIKNAETINNTKLHNKFLQAQADFVYSNAYRENNDYVTGQKFINKSISLFESLPKSNNLGEAYIEATQYFSLADSEQIQKRIAYFMKANQVFKSTGNNYQASFTLKNVGDLKLSLQNYIGAITDLKEALVMCPKSEPQLIAGIYDLLGTVFLEIGDYGRSVENNLMAVKTSEQAGDTTLQTATIYYRLASAYSTWHKPEESTYYIQRAFDVAKRYKNVDYMVEMLPSLCKKLNDAGKCQQSLDAIHLLERMQMPNEMFIARIYASYIYTYIAAALPVQAKKYVQKLELLLGKYNDETSFDFFFPIQSLVEFYRSDGEYVKAKFYSDKLFMLFGKSSNVSVMSLLYKLRSGIDSSLGDYHSALINYYAYKKLADSVTDASKSVQIAEMEVEYKTEKTASDLKLNQQKLQTVNALNKLQAQDLKQANLIRNIIIAVALLITIFLFLGYRYKQKNNIQLLKQQDAINLQNDQLKELIQQKEWLLKEVHHRVKNNLQIVISLLSTQSKFLNNKDAVKALSESRHRMQAMSLIHQKLYQSDTTTSVDMKEYITELISYLKTGFDNGSFINFDVYVDNIHLDTIQAIPLGLILNEAITNSIKYAFNESEAGCINVSMHSYENLIKLNINDNGAGLPEDYDWQNSSSLGMRLINGLTKQLNATINIKNRNGVHINIEFESDSVVTKMSNHFSKPERV